MWYTRRLMNALQASKLRGIEAVPLSDNTLKEVILKALGKPTSTDEIRYFKRNRSAKAVAPCFAGEIRPKLRLVATAIEHAELPEATLPEVAFYGRTNSGKSCLINAICGRFGVCTVKDNPGTTRKIHFYKVGTPSSIILVDLPGYGYSTAKEDITLQWNEFSLSYLKHRESLKLVVILVDSRHGLKQSDLEVINFCDKYKIRWQIVMAKADTVKPVLLAKMMHKVRLESSSFRSSNGKVVAVSSTKNQNLDEIRAIVDAFKVDKHTARSWSNVKPTRKPVDKTNTPELKIDAPTKMVVLEPERREVANHPLSETDKTGTIAQKYNLWAYMGEKSSPYTTGTVALRCIAEIFDTMTPPPGLLECIPEKGDALPVEMPIEPIVSPPVEPTFVEMDGSLMCNINISLEDTLARNETPEVVQENLLQDKLASYKRRVAMGMQTSPSISRPQIGRSYKRILSLYKKELKPKRLSWNVLDRNKLTWSAVYQKWEKWSRKHPQLAGTIESPTKRDVIASERKIRIRKHQLQVHQQRKTLRQAAPKINKKLPL